MDVTTLSPSTFLPLMSTPAEAESSPDRKCHTNCHVELIGDEQYVLLVSPEAEDQDPNGWTTKYACEIAYVVGECTELRNFTSCFHSLKHERNPDWLVPL